MNKDMLKEMVHEVNRSRGVIVIALKETKRELMTVYCTYGKVSKQIVISKATGECTLRRYFELLDVDSEIVANIKEEDIDSYTFNIDDDMVIYLKG